MLYVCVCVWDKQSIIASNRLNVVNLEIRFDNQRLFVSISTVIPLWK